jgi:hypothetical protein
MTRRHVDTVHWCCSLSTDVWVFTHRKETCRVLLHVSAAWSWRQHHDSGRCAAVFKISFVSTVLLSLRHVADIVSWCMPVCGLTKREYSAHSDATAWCYRDFNTFYPQLRSTALWNMNLKSMNYLLLKLLIYWCRKLMVAQVSKIFLRLSNSEVDQLVSANNVFHTNGFQPFVRQRPGKFFFYKTRAWYNWCQGPVPGGGPAVEKHWSTPCIFTIHALYWTCDTDILHLHAYKCH